ncbi:MAG: Hsp70 family protein [Treponema sp.]|jgi:cell division septation protein DedD|nr:Hsp70 family protein [Treponema sp.]
MSKFDRVIVSRKFAGQEGAESMAATIGIKIANGDFYSIIEENSSIKKRLVLTTVHDRQRSVQIDLYRSLARSMADAQYIGSLVVEKIKPKPRGEPSIELIIASSEKGDITAEAVDLDTGVEGESHVLNVSLQTLDEDTHELEIPDFEIEQNDHPPAGLYQQAEAVREEEKKTPWILLVLLGLLLLLGLAALWFFFLGGKALIFPENQSSAGQSIAAPAPVPPPPVEVTPAPPPAPPPAAVPAPPPPPPPVIEAPSTPPPPKPQTVERQRPSAPVASYKVPATIPKEGVPYRIRWGDTLWDIAGAFYRNPWLYPRIARFNRIRNPDLIISGTTIRIPPKN